MPVDIDRFERGDHRGERPTSERILRYLANNDGQAFTRREIAAAVEADPETVGTNLTRLKGRGLVRHRAPYWAFTDDLARARDVLTERYDEAVAAAIVGAAGVGDRGETDRGTATTAQRDSAAPARPHRRAAQAYVDRVHDRLPEAVEAVYRFGSVARGTEDASSDVDVLAVVADEAEFTAVDDVLLELAYDVQLEHEVRVEVHAVRAGEFADRLERGDPFVRRVLAEAEVGA